MLFSDTASNVLFILMRILIEFKWPTILSCLDTLYIHITIWNLSVGSSMLHAAPGGIIYLASPHVPMRPVAAAVTSPAAQHHSLQAWRIQTRNTADCWWAARVGMGDIKLVIDLKAFQMTHGLNKSVCFPWLFRNTRGGRGVNQSSSLLCQTLNELVKDFQAIKRSFLSLQSW